MGVLSFNREVLAKALDIQKAVNSPDTGWFTNVANVIEQPEVQREVANIVDRLNPIRVNMPRIPGSGSAYRYTDRVAGLTPAAFLNETTDPIRSGGAYEQRSFVHKTIGARGRFGRLAQKIATTLYDLVGTELQFRGLDFRDFEDQQYIRGDLLANSAAFDGYDRLLGIKGVGGSAGSTYTSQVISNSGIANIAVTGTTLTANLMDQFLDRVTMGETNAIICSRAGRRALLKLIHAQGQYVNTVVVQGGHKLPSWNNIPIFVSTNISDTSTSNGSTYSSYTGGTMTTLYAVSWDEVFVSELTPITTMPLAQVSSQYMEFDIFCDEVLVYRRVGGLAALMNINPAFG